MRDDGVGPDSIAHDGVYSARSERLEPVGFHYVDLAALREDSPGSYTVLAQAKDAINVYRSRSRLNGRFRDYGRDTDGDGFFNELVVHVGFRATDPGRYSMFAALADAKGGRYEARGTAKVLVPGEHSIELRFDGERLFERGQDGPFSFAKIVFSEEDEYHIAILEQRADGYRTRPYRFREFEREPTGISRDVEAREVDRDGDGQPDALDIGLLVRIDVPGEYWWQGDLEDTLGHGSVHANGSGRLESGDQRLVLRFRGSLLRPLGSPGAYRLNEFWVSGPAPAVTASGIRVPGVFPSDRFDMKHGP